MLRPKKRAPSDVPAEIASLTGRSYMVDVFVY
jgi:hypothetical protein